MRLYYLRMTTLPSNFQGAEKKHSWTQLALTPYSPSLLVSAARIPGSGGHTPAPPTAPAPYTTGAGAVTVVY